MPGDRPPKSELDPAFAPTQAMEPVQGHPAPVSPAPAATGAVARAAAQQLGASLGRRVAEARTRGASIARDRLKRTRRWLRGNPRTAAAACAGLVVALLVFALCGVRAGSPHSGASGGPALRPELRTRIETAIARGDRVSALAFAREADGEGAGVTETLLRARLASELREYGETLEALERARAARSEVAREPTFVALAVQTFNAGRPSRTLALLSGVGKEQAVEALQAATTDWSYRVRHGAADGLKAMGLTPGDPVALGLLDVWQLERCDQRSAVAARLLAGSASDERIVPALQAAARRPSDDGCLREVLPARGAGR